MRFPLASSPPLRACVGAVASEFAVPARLPSWCAGSSCTFGRWNGAVLPPGSPAGAPWLLFHGKTSQPISGYGYDLDGAWWCVFGSEFTKCGGPGSAGGIGATITQIVTDYVVPALSAAAIALVPGGGIALSAALKAWSSLARGSSLNEALIGATRDSIPALIGGTAFDRGLKMVRDNLPASAIAAAKNALPSPEQKTAFDTGQIVAVASAKQQAALTALLPRVREDLRDRVQVAMDNNAQLDDVAAAIGGNKAILFVNDQISKTSVPSAIGTGSSSSGKSSGGIGLGTVAVLGGGGYLAYKYGLPYARAHFPKLFHSAAKGGK